MSSTLGIITIIIKGRWPRRIAVLSLALITMSLQRLRGPAMNTSLHACCKECTMRAGLECHHIFERTGIREEAFVSISQGD